MTEEENGKNNKERTWVGRWFCTSIYSVGREFAVSPKTAGCGLFYYNFITTSNGQYFCLYSFICHAVATAGMWSACPSSRKGLWIMSHTLVKFMGMVYSAQLKVSLELLIWAEYSHWTFLWFLSVIQFAIKMFTDLLDKDLALNAFLLGQTFFQRILLCSPKWPIMWAQLLVQTDAFKYRQRIFHQLSAYH